MPGTTHPPFNSVVAQKASALRHAIDLDQRPLYGFESTLSVLSPWFPRVTGGFLIPVHKIVNNAERFPFGPGIKATIHAKFNTSTVQCVSPLLANSTFWLRVNSI